MENGIVKHIKDSGHKETPYNQLRRYGILHKEYLKGYSDSLYEEMIIKGCLYVHCLEVQDRAEKMMDDLVSKLEQEEGVTEELKRRDPFEWMRRKILVLTRSEEAVFRDIVYRI